MIKQARRLLTSHRAQAQLVKFHMMWLGTDTVSSLAKNMNAYPGFPPLLAYYMAKETDQFLRKTLFEEGGTFASDAVRSHLRERADGRVLRHPGRPRTTPTWVPRR